MPSFQNKIQHLYWRAGFGATISEVQFAKKRNLRDIAEQLFSDSQHFQPLEIIDANPLANPNELRKSDRASFREMVRESTALITDLNWEWIKKMASGKASLREKMTFFWHDHFACRLGNCYFAQGQNNTLRKHALGKFRDLLVAMAKDPGMLNFLNNKQNKKRQPNENFARELLELFTLGVGNYSEQDIKEAARAFTGWRANPTGEFELSTRHHDYGFKTFMGKKGRLSGEDVIDVILKNPQCARFITEKIYRYFVNEELDSEKVEVLSKQFYQSGYDIELLLRKIFTSDWFYDEKHIGAKIKSPIELLVGLIRTFDVRFNNAKPVVFLEAALGQTLFNPPNVAGWPSGKEWIDSSSLLTRLRMPEFLFKAADIDIRFKESPQEMGTASFMNGNKRLQRIRKIVPRINSTEFIVAFKYLNKSDRLIELTNYLWQTESTLSLADIEPYVKSNDREDEILDTAHRLMGMPEYQLC
jgi:uncharacterized protein (DUF1800 family)